MDELITVQTDLFNHRVVKPHFINPCCFGEDFAAWLREQLSPLADFGFKLSKIIQEDYGWGFWPWHGKDPFWLALVPTSATALKRSQRNGASLSATIPG
ncbi:MAG: hypothetical protein ACXV5J_06325 [Candidatus Angelobacter sp.]